MVEITPTAEVELRPKLACLDTCHRSSLREPRHFAVVWSEGIPAA
jgi:hypothetical protein